MGLDYIQQNTRIQMFFFKNYPSVISISRVRHAKKQVFRHMPKTKSYTVYVQLSTTIKICRYFYSLHNDLIFLSLKIQDL